MGTVPALTDETPLDQYISTASQTDFTFTFMIFDTSDIKVYVNNILKAESTDYVVKQSDNSSIVPATDLPMDGGKIVFNTGLANLDAVSLSREIPINRLTGFSLAGAFRSNVLNTELTRMQSIMQQLERDISRSLRLSASDAEGGTFTLPSNRASTFLAFDASGNMIASAGTIGASPIVVSAFMETVLDDTTAAAARTTLGLAIGSEVQAFDADLTDIAALTCARGDILVGNSSSDWANLPIGAANKVLVSDGTDVSWGDPSVATNLTINNKLNTQPNSATISSGAITYAGYYTIISGEGASNDTLTTINGGSQGDKILIDQAGQVITIEDGSGNIQLPLNQNIVLVDGASCVELIFDGSNWVSTCSTSTREQDGIYAGGASTPTIVFPVAFTTAVTSIVVTAIGAAAINGLMATIISGSVSTTSFQCEINRHDANPETSAFYWRAKGY
jgi:hypothetical protein